MHCDMQSIYMQAGKHAASELFVACNPTSYAASQVTMGHAMQIQ
jgi:hypothetical protein